MILPDSDPPDTGYRIVPDSYYPVPDIRLPDIRYIPSPKYNLQRNSRNFEEFRD